MLTIRQLKRKAEWAERKAEENANSDKPWGNAQSALLPKLRVQMVGRLFCGDRTARKGRLILSRNH